MFYVYITENNIVNYVGEQKPINRIDSELLITKELPKCGYDYLVAKNIKEESIVIDGILKVCKTCDLVSKCINNNFDTNLNNALENSEV